MKTRNKSYNNQYNNQYNNNDNIDNEIYDELLEDFTENVEAIYDGSFFERIPLEDNLTKLKNNIKYKDLKRLNNQLIKLKKNYKNSCPSIISVLNMNISNEKKQELLEKIYMFTNSEVMSPDYYKNLKALNNVLENKNDDELKELEQELEKKCSYNIKNDLKTKILKSNMSMQNKIIAYNKFKILESYNDESDSEYFKYKIWLDSLLQIPFGIYKTISLQTQDESREYLKKIRIKLDEKLSFLEKPKDQFINMISHSIKNPLANFNAIGLHGIKGTGKTSLVSSLAEAIDRPYRIISLGGESDASGLTGHHFTYIGSTAGRIAEILKETQCMNPIILFDEIDKTSDTPQGKEIISALIHLTDTTTNKKYTYDKYFSGIEFDLSQIMFFFTYNDSEKINKILLDRLYKIHIDNYTDNEKFTIVQKHLIPNTLKEYNFHNNIISFPDETIKHIIKLSNNSEGSDGMRDVKGKLNTIVSRINTLLSTNKSDNIVRLDYKSLYNKYTNLSTLTDETIKLIKVTPINITTFDVDILLKNSDSSPIVNNNNTPFGMYM